MKKYRTCEICGKKALFVFSPDMDIRGLGACKKHKQDMQLAYIILLQFGEKEYREFIDGLKIEFELPKIKIKKLVGLKKFKKICKGFREAIEEEDKYRHKHETNGLEPHFPSVWGKEK